MAPEFWTFGLNSKLVKDSHHVCIERHLNGTPFRCFDNWTLSREIGRSFLAYAYSTPAGVVYRLTYGISKE